MKQATRCWLGCPVHKRLFGHGSMFPEQVLSLFVQLTLCMACTQMLLWLCAAAAERCCWWADQAVGKALREREAALLTVAALEAELGRKRRGIGSLEEAGSQVRVPAPLHRPIFCLPAAICAMHGGGLRNGS